MDKKAQISIVASFMTVFVFAIVASVLVGPLGDEVFRATDVNSGGTGNLSSTDATLLRLWPTFFISGILLAILALVGLS